MTQTVSLLTLTCNNAGKAQRCMVSWLPILKTDQIAEWLILDNASKDGMVDWLLKFSAVNKKIRVIYSRKNLGCAGGRDVLFKQAAGDLLLSLDSDVKLVNRNAVRLLAAELNNPKIGIVGDHGGGVRADWTWTEEAPSDYEGEIPIVSGYCQMFRRSALQHVGLDLFYSPYWLEDSDFCFQLRDKLGQVGLIKHCGVQHVWSGTNSGGTLEQAARWAHFREKWQKKFGVDGVYPPLKPQLVSKVAPVAVPSRRQRPVWATKQMQQKAFAARNKDSAPPVVRVMPYATFPAFVINLNRRLDRWAAAQKEFVQLGWPVTRLAAVDAQPGWQGCLASHRAAWQAVLDSKRVAAAIFEDDAVFPNDFIDIIGAAFRELPAYWDVWQLHSFHSSYRPIGQYIAQILSRGWGTHGYFVTAEACQKLLAMPDNKVDSLITEDFRLAGGKLYGIVPKFTLCFQRGDDSDIAETAQTKFWRKQLDAHALRFGPSAKK